MKNGIKTTIILGLVTLLLIPSITMNVSAIKTTAEIQAEVEARVGMRLTLVFQYNLTNGPVINGYELLFMPQSYAGIAGTERFFEAYYNGRSTVVTERFLENRVWSNSSGSTILSGTLTLTLLTGLKVRIASYRQGNLFAGVWAVGVFFIYNNLVIARDHSFIYCFPPYTTDDWTSYPQSSQNQGYVYCEGLFHDSWHSVFYWAKVICDKNGEITKEPHT